LEISNNIFKREWRLIAFILGVVLVFALLWIFWRVLLPFIVGLILAYLLYPLIAWMEKKMPVEGKWYSARRTSLITAIFIVIVVIVGLLTFYVFTGVVSSFSTLLKNAPQYFSQGLHTVQDWLQTIQKLLPAQTQQQTGDLAQNMGTALGNALGNVFTKGVSMVSSTFGVIVSFVALPVFLFYMLKDWEKIKASFYSAFSPQIAVHIRGVMAVIDKVLGRWVRAQLMLSVVVAVMCFIGLIALGIKLAPALAALQGLMEFIPILGPWIGGAIGVIVVLAIAPQKAIWVAVVYLAVQLLENLLLVPRIHGTYMRIHPAAILVLLPLGAYIAGLWGIILVVPLTATIIELINYARHNLTARETRPAAD
jgi:predicted PurR-regulated permease PerM